MIIIIFSILIVISPVEFKIRNGYVMYSYGMATKIVYTGSFINIALMLFCLVKNYKNIKSKKYLPIYVYLLFGTVTTVVQNAIPELLLATTMETFVTVVMYFTIENPDVKMVDELISNRRLIMRTSEEKEIFNFRIKEWLKRPIKNIDKEVSIYKNNKLNKKDIDEVIDNIEHENRNIKYLIDEAMGINVSLKNSLKRNEGSYNIYNLIKNISVNIKSKIKDDTRFNVTYQSSMPKYLKGDSIKLKQVLLSIINNILSSNNSGYLYVDINTISKDDVARIIFNIETSIKEFNIKEINEILNQELELSNHEKAEIEKTLLDIKLCYKVIRLLGGTMYIESDNNKSDIIIAIDQEIVIDNDIKKQKEIDNYIGSRSNKKRVMLVDDDEVEIRKIKNILEEKGYEVVISMFKDEAINKINSGRYDLLIVDDEMITGSGLSIIKESNSIKSKKIIMLEDDKLFISRHYLEDGFDEYIDKTNLEEEISNKC